MTLVAALALIACATSTGATRNTTAQRVRAAPERGAGDERVANAGRRCRVPRAPRTFVGFDDHMSVATFELAAREAQRVLAMLDARLCAQASALDPSGVLGAGLRARTLELFEIRFVRADASMAQVRLRAIEGSTPSHYEVDVTRRSDQWAVRSASAP